MRRKRNLPLVALDLLPRIRVRLLWEPRDLWIGVFVDERKQKLYILPIPTLGIVIRWGTS